MLLPTTTVWTSKSYKKIKNVTSQDRVLTHNGLFKKVDKVIRKLYIGDIIVITPYKDESTALTPEHKVVCIKIKDNTFGWTEARNLEKGDKIVFPKIKEDVDNLELYKDAIRKENIFEHDEYYYFIPIEDIITYQINYPVYTLVVAEDRSFVTSVVVLANTI